MKSKIIAKLILCFEKDLDMQNITEIVGLYPSDSKRMSSTRINPISGIHNCGFWEVQTSEIESYDSVEAQNILLSLTHNYLDKIKHVIETYNGEVIYRFFIWIDGDDFPALMFSENFLADVNYLNAKLDVVLTTL
jgi:hypothetical protein